LDVYSIAHNVQIGDPGGP